MKTTTLADLPKIGEPLDAGTFAGITTELDGKHVAIILLPDQGTDLDWKAATAWAKKLDAQLPTRPIAALLYANVKPKLRPQWHWTCEPEDASYAWGCYFSFGFQNYFLRSFQGCAFAVRTIPLTA